MGATVLSGLTGNLDLPKMSQATTVQWIDEGEVIPETDTSFETVEIRPNTLASRLPVTRRLLLQASQNYDLELILRQDLVTSIAVEADRAAINGSGTGNEPLGLINNSNVTTLSLGSDGGQITYDNVVDLESAIASNNADIGSLGYVMSPSVRGAMKKTAVEPGTDRFIFEPLPQPDPNMPGAGYVNGYIAQASTTVPSDLTKGSGTGLSALIFGNWSDLYFGEFGAIDVTANPYGRMFPSGGVELRAMMDMDIKPRRTESFAVISDIIV
jgi:HK97 family phage major capsid protein